VKQIGKIGLSWPASKIHANLMCLQESSGLTPESRINHEYVVVAPAWCHEAPLHITVWVTFNWPQFTAALWPGLNTARGFA